MKKLLVLLFTLLTSLVVSAHDSCATRFSELEARLLPLGFVDQRQIFQELEAFRKACGKQEFSERIALILSIGLGRFKETDGRAYLNEYGDEFIYRLEHEGRKNTAADNPSKLRKLGYNPLRSQLDSWVAGLAEEVLGFTRGQSFETALLALFSGRSSEITTYWDWQEELYEYIHPFYLRLGNYMNFGPVDNQRIPSSVRIDLGIKARIMGHWGAYLGFSFVPLNKAMSYDVLIRAVKLTTEANNLGQFSIGPRYTQKVSKRTSVAANFGLAYQFLDTDIKKYSLRNNEDSTDFFTSSLSFPVVLELGRDGSYFDWGVFLGYQFSWFTIDRRMLTTLKPHAFSTGLYARF
ncbi:MAG TPA: hypothetical protein VFV37_10045 [Luteibaculaceae bacterium]|nr:hypothetical protein [Luteibaculaceae bacterium]